ESLPVGALLMDDLGTLDEPLVVDQQGASLAATDALGLVETQGAEFADPSQRSAPKAGADTMRGVLDHDKSVTRGKLSNCVHVTRHACVVNWHNGFRPWGSCLWQSRGVEAESVVADVDEHRRSAACNDCIRGRDEGE